MHNILSLQWHLLHPNSITSGLVVDFFHFGSTDKEHQALNQHKALFEFGNTSISNANTKESSGKK